MNIAALLIGATLPIVVVVFALAAAVIAVAGTALTRNADRLADVTGMGEALFGAVLLGGMTSLPGIVTSVTAGWQGHPELAVSNAVGGIAVQTAFLAVADMSYRRANLEHAAASLENLLQGALLVTLLAIPLLAMAGPQIAPFGIHPASPVLILAYLGGLHLVATTRERPLWRPRQTAQTRLDRPDPRAQDVRSEAGLWLGFLLLGVLVAIAGYVVARSGIVIAQRTGLSESVVGGLMTAVVTSLPELVTAVAAVRRGALTLAVGGIIGGNCFDVLFIACADIAFREGSLYHAISMDQVFIIALTQLLTGILLLGLLHRERKGIGNIGFESFLVIVLYLGAAVVMLSRGGSG